MQKHNDYVIAYNIDLFCKLKQHCKILSRNRRDTVINRWNLLPLSSSLYHPPCATGRTNLSFHKGKGNISLLMHRAREALTTTLVPTLWTCRGSVHFLGWKLRLEPQVVGDSSHATWLLLDGDSSLWPFLKL